MNRTYDSDGEEVMPSDARGHGSARLFVNMPRPVIAAGRGIVTT